MTVLSTGRKVVGTSFASFDAANKNSGYRLDKRAALYEVTTRTAYPLTGNPNQV